MRNKALPLCGLTLGLAMAFSTAVNAQPVRVFGPPAPGHARPPLYLNRGPFGKPGRGGGGGTTSVYYTPAQIRHAYGFDQLTADGTGQTIAIVDAYGSPTILQDLATFDTAFGLPPANVVIPNPQPGGNSGWAQETSLDVEWAHAIAPGATILLVIAPTASFSDLLNAVDQAVSLHASAVSMSWGGGEFSGETSLDVHFRASGVTFVASSGDSGEGRGVEWPAASPYVVGVGGTTLYLTTSNTRSSETAWSGSGGGISVLEAIPPWQVGWSSYLGSFRGVPDVAYVGNPSTGVLVYYNGAPYVFGGTSVGAPQWSALVALSNEMRASGTLGTANPTGAAIYSVANGGTSNGLYSINPHELSDIVSGNNGRDADDFAIAGYDLVTGLGSPVANNLAPALSSK